LGEEERVTDYGLYHAFGRVDHHWVGTSGFPIHRISAGHGRRPGKSSTNMCTGHLECPMSFPEKKCLSLMFEGGMKFWVKLWDFLGISETGIKRRPV
jgi:hypothetical protein